MELAFYNLELHYFQMQEWQWMLYGTSHKDVHKLQIAQNAIVGMLVLVKKYENITHFVSSVLSVKDSNLCMILKNYLKIA